MRPVAALVLALLSALPWDFAQAFPIDPRIDPRVAQERVARAEDRDAALAQKVKRSLVGDIQPDPYGIEVTASDGVVRLFGTVPSEFTRKRLGIGAAAVVGVRGVQNRIVVGPGA